MEETELWDRATSCDGGYREASPDAVQGAQGLRVVDVREPSEFSGPLGHLPGAELVPIASVAGACAGWGQDETIVLVCRSGRRSAQVARELAARGFKRVINMRGGMLKNAELGLPVAGAREEGS